MERIISYKELPFSRGQKIYFRMETDPKLYMRLLSAGYKIINNITDADEETLYLTGKRQDRECSSIEEYRTKVHKKIEDLFRDRDIVKPVTVKFSCRDLFDHKYKLPFVLKNENQNGGREKFLIATLEDYDNLISSCQFLLSRNLMLYGALRSSDPKFHIDYDSYLDVNFSVQEYIETPTEYNTTVRVLTSSSNDLLYSALKYKEPCELYDNTTLLGYLLSKVYPLSTPSIVSNTLSGGKNILIGDKNYTREERYLLDRHNIDSDKFNELLESASLVHEKCREELGILCGFDFIYDEQRDKWFLLEYHSRPMVGDYSKRQGIKYDTKEERITADGRVRATALSLALKKK